jgi:L-alanine-DL-glutamate epimerase-like enolase superfamily enzyme
MTIARLKQSMDRGFRSVDRRFRSVDRRLRLVDRRFQLVDRRFRSVDRHLARLERKKADKSDVRRLERKVDWGFREIRQEIKDTAGETRRHFDAVVESLRDDFRLFADAIARHTERLDQHDIRIGRL